MPRRETEFGDVVLRSYLPFKDGEFKRLTCYSSNQDKQSFRLKPPRLHKLNNWPQWAERVSLQLKLQTSDRNSLCLLECNKAPRYRAQADDSQNNSNKSVIQLDIGSDRGNSNSSLGCSPKSQRHVRINKIQQKNPSILRELVL